MTVLRPRDLAPSGKTSLAPTGAVGAAGALEFGAFDARADDARDAIILSLRASLLMRAGLAVHALVMDALSFVQRTVTIGRTTIVLEYGIYR